MNITKAAIKLNSAWRRQWPTWRALPPVFLLSDPVRLADPRPHLHRLPRGGGVIYRCYGNTMTYPERLRYTRDLRAACHGRGLVLLIAGDDRLALETGADGIHLAEWRLARRSWQPRAMRSRGGLVTAACHGRRALHLAAEAAVDAALLAPVFATDSRPHAPSLGPLRFAALVRQSAVPVYALGGIGPGNVGRLNGSGAVGIAAIGAIIGEQGAKA